MASENLESNVVLQTHVPKPKGSGFKDTLTGLDKIEKRLVDITSKVWTIRVKIDDKQAKKLGISFGGGAGGAGGGGTGGVGGFGGPVSSGGGITIRQRRIREGKEGPITTDTATQESIKGFEQLKNAVKEIDGALAETTNTSTNLFEKQRVAADRYYAKQLALKKLEQERLQILRGIERKVASNLSSGNPAFAGVTATERRFYREEQRREQQAAASVRQPMSHTAVASRYQQLLGEGYQQYTTRSAYSKKSGQFEQEVELRKISGNALQGYTVQVAKANLATNELRERTVRGAEAFRMVGDSIANASVKVSTWLIATSLVFATIRGFQTLGSEILKLEAGSILLARVGRNLGGSFDERFAASKRLTRGFLDLTAAIGGNASESQQAAAIFARSGYNEVEVLQAVKASLLAAKIAELDVVESANLLNSATLQFNRTASDVLPTLDLLNTYSNNFRVTTNDLLQSISRTGSVIAQQNGSLAELAAITAVTSQATSRSGSEIGNAIKTIVSNLDRLDTRQQIFDKMGILLTNMDGTTKGYAQTLLELKLNTDRLTDSERAQLGINIAGLRQRNILLQQMKDALKNIKGQVTGLFQQGGDNKDSALNEFAQNAGSLVSSLQRLKAEAISAGSDVSGPFQEIAKGVAGALDMILRLLGIFNGAPAKLLGWVAALGLITLGLRYMHLQYGAVSIATLKYIGESIKAALADIFRAGSIRGTIIAMKQQVASTIVANQAMIAYTVTAGVVLATLMVLSKFTSDYAESLAILEAKHIGEASAAQAAASVARDKAEAYRASADAIGAVIAKMKELRKEEVSSGKKNPEIDILQKQAQEIATAVGVDLGPDRIPNAVKTQQQFQEAQQREQQTRANALKTQMEALQKERERREKELFDKAFLLKGYQSIIGGKAPRTPEEQDQARQAGFDFTEKKGLAAASLQGITDAMGATNFREAELEKIKERIRTLNKEAIEDASKEQKIKAEILSLEERLLNTAAQQERRAKLLEESSDFAIAEKRRGDRDKVRDFTRGLIGGPNSLQLQKDYSTSLQETNAQWSRIVELQEKLGANAEEIKSANEAYNTSLERTINLGKQRDAAAAASIRKEARARLDFVGDLNQQAGMIGFQRKRGLSDTTSSMFDPVAENAEERRLLMQGIERDRQVAASSKNPLEAKEAQLRIAEELERLRGLEKEGALSLLRVEKDIAIARKQSADEAARALGSLSTTDKLAALGQAAYFAKNPDAKLSLGQQFLMGGESVSVAQRLFGGKLQGLENRNDPIANLFRAADIGGSPELNRARKEYTEARGRLTDRHILERGEEAWTKAGEAKSRVEGTDRMMQQFTQGLGPNIPVHVDVNAMDFGPLQKTFENSFMVIMDEKMAKLAVWFKDLLDKRTRTDPKFPKINAGGE